MSAIIVDATDPVVDPIDPVVSDFSVEHDQGAEGNSVFTLGDLGAGFETALPQPEDASDAETETGKEGITPSQTATPVFEMAYAPLPDVEQAPAPSSLDTERDETFIEDSPALITPADVSDSAVITVSDAAGLAAALAAAQDGTVIRLNGGDYGAFHLEDYTTSVTLQSDPADPAVFSLVQCENVQGLTFDGVVFDYTFTKGDAEWDRPFRFSQCEDITVKNTLVDGDMAYGRGDEKDGYGTGTGLRFEYCSDIQILDNEVRGFRDNVQLNVIENIVMSGNEIHHMREDAVEFGSLTNALFENNYLHDTAGYPLPEGAAAGSGDHPDFFQINGGGERSPSSNLTFRGNLMDQGDGTGAQGIFLTNHDDVPWKSITIEDNIFINTYANGIKVGLTDGLTVRNNTIVHAAWDEENSYTPAIRLDHGSTNVVVTGNIAGTNAILHLPEDWETGDNFVVQSTDPDGANYYPDHFVGISGDLGGHPEKFFLNPDSEIYAAGAGSSHVYEGNAIDPSAVVARMLVQQASASDDFMFDASLSFLPELSEADEAPDLDTDATALIAFSSATGDVTDADGDRLVDLDPGALDLRALDGLVTVERAAIAPMLEAEDFRIDLSMQIDTSAESVAGEIMRLDRAFKINVTDQGEVVLRLKTIEGGWYYIKTKGAGLADGAAHTLSVRYRADDTIQVVVDGNVRAEQAIVGTLDPGIGPILAIGGQFGNTPTAAVIDALSIVLDAEPQMSVPEPGNVGIFQAGPMASAAYDTGSVEDAAEGYRFIWNFEDGTEIDGVSVAHSFETAGYHDVTLTIIGENGSVDTTAYTVGVAGSDLLGFDPTTGSFYNQAYAKYEVLVELDPGAIDLRDLEALVEINRTDIQSMLTADGFHIDMVLSVDPTETDGFGGEVMRLDRSFVIAITDAGEVDLRVKTADAVWHRLITKGAGLDDGVSHDVSFRFDASDSIEVVVDDVVLAETEITHALDPGIGGVMVVGGQYGAEAFGGFLEDLEIDLHTEETLESMLFGTMSDLVAAQDWDLLV